MSNKARAKPARRPVSASRSPFAKSRGRLASAAVEPVGLGVQRWTVIVAVAGAQLAVLTSSADPVNVVKLTVVLLAAIALLTVSVVRIATERSALVPTGVPTCAAAAFGASAVISAIVAPATGIALWGGYLRNAGLLLYLAALILYVTVVRVADEQFVRRLVYGIVIVGGLLSFYSILQRAGVDPIPWEKAYANPISTFGNPDFAGAFFGIALPLAIWVGVWSALGVRARIAAGIAAGLLLAGDIVSGAAQGFVGAAAAVFVLLLGWIITRPTELRRRALAAWSTAAAVGLGLLLAGLASAGPLARLGGTGAVSIRRHFWRIAVDMFAHHPVVGVGMNMYGEYFRGYRSAAVVSALGYKDAPDAPHSVPIGMFANGGLFLGLSYLVFIVAVGVALVRSLRSDDRSAVMLTAAIGAAWVAFQVESAVSIDVVPLVTLHFVLAGAIVARCSPTVRRLGPRSGPGRRNPRAPTLNPLAVGAVGIAGFVLAWFAIQPLRADVNAASGAKATARGDTQAALGDLENATSEASWQGVYWLQRAKADGAVGNVQQGLADLRHALDANPRDVDAAISLARVEAVLKEYGEAAKYYRVAILLDPRNPELRAGLKDVEDKQSSAAQ